MRPSQGLLVLLLLLLLLLLSRNLLLPLLRNLLLRFRSRFSSFPIVNLRHFRGNSFAQLICDYLHCNRRHPHTRYNSVNLTKLINLETVIYAYATLSIAYKKCILVLAFDYLFVSKILTHFN